MPSNQQRREAAKRKLERQLVRRQERAKARRQRLLIGGVVVAVLAVGGIVAYVTLHKSTPSASSSTGVSGSSDSVASSSAAPATPCTYTTTDVAKAVKDVKVPTNLSPANTGNVDVTITLNGQSVPITLNRKLAPCGVNSFLSLAGQGFYDNTDCWRLTKSEQLNILQCGDPSGKGNGGPGYTFADENATATDYPVGTIAYANSGTDTNGSQFFIVYGKTHLTSAQYSVIGTVSSDGMKVIQDIAAKGVTGGLQTGAPVEKATISKVAIPDGSTTAEGTYTSASPSPSELPSEAVPSDSAESGASDTSAAASSTG